MKEELEKKCYIDKVYSFENFITNESNVEIFELLKNYPNMNMKYNPIVIEGIFGTGKTHLNAFKNEHSDKYNIKIVECFDFSRDIMDNLIKKRMSHLQIAINNPQFKLNQIQKKPFEIV